MPPTNAAEKNRIWRYTSKSNCANCKKNNGMRRANSGNPLCLKVAGNAPNKAADAVRTRAISAAPTHGHLKNCSRKLLSHEVMPGV